MGSHTFRWEQPAEEVFVTGTFDNWTKSVKLEKKDLVHEKTVAVADITHPLTYKFVVDGEWHVDPSKKTELDHDGNENNVLYASELAPPNSMASQTISSVAPGSSTAQLAGLQPLESKSVETETKTPAHELPGAFPETPMETPAPTNTANDEKKDGILAGAAATGAAALAAVGGTAAYLTGSNKKEAETPEQTFSVNPIPASEGAGNPVHLAPGEPVPASSTINSNTLTSNVHDDPSLKSSAQDTEQTFGVAPIPASGGIGNPIHLQPGEKVPEPSSISANTLTSNVKLDQASYEKSDSGAPQLPPVLTPQSEREAGGAAIFTGLGPQTTNMIPESSMGMGSEAPAPLEGAAINSVGAGSTTNQLAGQQPLEPRGVPAVVAESQKEAHASPEAAANPVAVEEKKEVENELKSKVPEEPAADSSNTGGITGAIAGGVAAAGAAVTGAAVVAREKTHQATGTDPVSVLPTSVQQSIDGINQKSDTSTAAGVPQEVLESQKAAHVSPEAAANPEAVAEKKDLEQELLQKVPATEAQGEPAPTEAAVLSAVAPAATSASGAPQLADPVGAGLAPINIDEKAAGSSGLNAPADAPATTPATTLAAQTQQAPQESRDVSPMSKPVGGTQQPTVTTGTQSGTVPSTSTPIGTPRTNNTASTPTKRNSIMGRFKSTPESQGPSTPDSQGKKKGFLSKLKEKFKS